MATTTSCKHDDFATELENSLKGEHSVQIHKSKDEFREALSENRENENQTIFCVLKLRRKSDSDDKSSSRSSPYVMFHSTKLFKVLVTIERSFFILCIATLLKKSELTNKTFPVSPSKTIVDSVADHHHAKQSSIQIK